MDEDLKEVINQHPLYGVVGDQKLIDSINLARQLEVERSAQVEATS